MVAEPLLHHSVILFKLFSFAILQMAAFLMKSAEIPLPPVLLRSTQKSICPPPASVQSALRERQFV